MKFFKFLGILFLAGIALSIVFQAIAPTSKPEKPKTPQEQAREFLEKDIELQVQTRIIIENHLKAPSTAKFDFAEPSKVISKDGKLVRILTGTVDSQNSFGAMLRSKFIATFTYKEGSKRIDEHITIEGKKLHYWLDF